MKTSSVVAIGTLLGLAAHSIPSSAQDVGVSINIGQPGFYGQIQLGDVPRPRIIYAQPVIVDRVRVVEAPIYLHVRPGQAGHWKDHCREYDACGRRVYFVNDNWYNTVYVPHYRSGHGGHDEGHHDEGHHDEGHDRDHDDHDDHGDHGHGNGGGHGHGNGHD